RESKDDRIYQAVLKIIESIYYLELMQTSQSDLERLQNNAHRASDTQPQTVQEAIARLIAELPLKDKTTIANMGEAELTTLNS
ncbi:hypothetical protein GWN26_15340, partial [Candidatus Saccharibacteria bacterium]|nr:hypothetical protein [Candidatus Saccharibacteria bacterium]